MARDIPLQTIASLVGRELGVSGWHAVTQQQIDEFARATGDYQWMHVDAVRAGRELGGTIAHGLLTLSLLPALSEQVYHVSGYAGGYSYGYDRVRFTRPVRSGSRVRLHMKLSEVAPRGAGLMITTACTIEVENQGEPALVADWRSLYFPPGAPAAPATDSEPHQH